MNEIQKNRLIELLADQAVFGLNQEELMELYQLKKQFPEWETDVSFELVAAAIALTDVNVAETLPANLRTRILAGADEFFGRNETAQNVVSFPVKAQEARVTTNQSETKQPFWQWLGWAVAAAACVALAVNLWLTHPRPSVEEAKAPKTVQTPESTEVPETVKTPEIAEIPEFSKIPDGGENNEPLRNREVARNPETVKTPEVFRTPNVVKTPEIVGIPKVPATPEIAKPSTPELSATQKRAQLLASAPDIIQTNWTSPKDDKRVLGDIVWSNAQQKGYVRLRDLPALDPSQETYQLWIVDEAQNEKTPVSGGIFNVSQAGEVIVPIDAQLKIKKPKMFAISKEKAGGVVVSKPNRFVAIAKI